MSQLDLSWSPRVDPELQSDVDCLILDYLVCLAIEQTFSAAETPLDENKAEEADWLVQSLKAFEKLISRSSICQDLRIKLDLLGVAHALRRHHGRFETEPCISTIGVSFMELCHSALHKVSQSRWLEVGAQFIIQSELLVRDLGPGFLGYHESSTEAAEEAEANKSSDNLRSWMFDDDPRKQRWLSIWQDCVRELNGHTVSEAREKYPISRFKDTVMQFLLDLMTTLDQPVLMQLERGKLGNLSRMETELLLQRVGIR